MPGHVFISYSRQDRAYVERLSAEITGAGLSVWFDHELAAGDKWSDILEQQIEDCAGLVVVMSAASARSTWVKREVRLAQDLGKPVVPLLLSGRVWFVVNELHHIDVTDGRVPDATFLRRLTALGATGPTRPASGTPTVEMEAAPDARAVVTSSKVRAHTGEVSAVTWAPDSPRFLTTGVDGTCQVWQAGSGGASRVIEVPQARHSLLAVWRNDNFVITGARDGLRWWDPKTGREVSNSLGHGRITTLQAITGYQSDHEVVVAGTATGRVLLVRMGSVEELTVGPEQRFAFLSTSNPETRVVAVAVGRNRRLTGDRTPMVAAVDLNKDGVSGLTVWPVPDSGPGRRSTVPLAPGTGPSAEQIAWSEAGDLAVANPVPAPGMKASAIAVWPEGAASARVAVPLWTTDGSRAAPATSVAWAPDGRRLAVGMTDGTVQICDVERRVVVRRLRSDSAGEVVIRWNAAGTLLATVAAGGRRRARIWRAGDGTPLDVIKMSVSALAWAPGGDALVAGGVDGEVWLHHFEG